MNGNVKYDKEYLKKAEDQLVQDIQELKFLSKKIGNQLKNECNF